MVGTNLEAIYNIMYTFRSHVEQIHEAEMFYGDQTLQALIDHSKELLDELDKYEDLMQIVGPEQVEGDAELLRGISISISINLIPLTETL